jgi:hypothetical protein
MVACPTDREAARSAVSTDPTVEQLEPEAEREPPAEPKPPKPPKRTKPAKPPAKRRRSKHVTERSGVLRRLRSGVALLFLTAITGAAVAAVTVGAIVVIVLALRHAAG